MQKLTYHLTTSHIDSLCKCIDKVNSWMCQNFLQLKKDKTEVIAFGNKV